MKQLPILTLLLISVLPLCGKKKTEPVLAPVQITLDSPAWVAITQRTQSRISFVWKSVDSAGFYLITRSLDSAGIFDSIGRTADTTFRDSGLSANTIYYYRIAPANESGVSKHTALLQAKTLPGISPPPTNVTASLNGNIITVSWKAPANAVSHYRLYRSTFSLADGSPDTASFSSVHAYVSGDSVSFSEKTGLASGVYWYALRTAIMADSDTVMSALGPAWPGFASCTVGSLVGFSINNGDLFTATRACTLTLDNPGGEITSVTFTGMYSTDTLDTAGIWRKSTGTARPDTNDLYAQMFDYREFVLSTTISTGAGSGSATRRFTPDFTRYDTLNTGAIITNPSHHVKTRWTLPPGRGPKRVFAEVRMLINGQQITDTLFDDILIKPLNISMSCVPSNTCRNHRRYDRNSYDDTSLIDNFIYYSSDIQFSIESLGNPLLSPTFDYWMMTSPVSKSIDPQLDNYSTWIMSNSVTGLLSNSGTTLFTASLDTIGTTAHSLLATGCAGKGFNIQVGITNNPKRVYDTLWRLEPTSSLFPSSASLISRPQSGFKDFLLVARFTGTEFKTPAICILGYNKLEKLFLTSLDCYPPVLNAVTDRNTLNFLDSASVITGPFNFGLRNPSIIDGGYEKIRSVSLVIARQPDAFVIKSRISSAVTPALLRSFRHEEFPFPVPGNTDSIADVQWNRIDPTGWPAGKYLFAIVTKDEFGHEGIATGYPETGREPVPFRISIGGY